MAKQPTLHYKDYRKIRAGDPGYTPEKKRAKRYFSPTEQRELPVRQFQRLANEQAKTLKYEAEQEKKQQREVKQAEKELNNLQRYFKVVSKAESGKASLSKALATEHMSRKTFEKVNEAREHYAGLVRQRGRRVVSTIYQASWLLPAFDEKPPNPAKEVHISVDQVNSRAMSNYWHTMLLALNKGDQALANALPTRIVDTGGNVHILITDINDFYIYLESMDMLGSLSDDFDRKIYDLLRGESLKQSKVQAA